MPTLVIIYPSRSGDRFALPATGTLIGRAPTCDISLARESLSRRHARIAWDADGWFVEDLGSTNGVSVNDTPVRRSALRDRDIVRLGSVTFQFVRDDNAGSPPIPPDDAPPDSGSGAPLAASLTH